MDDTSADRMFSPPAAVCEHNVSDPHFLNAMVKVARIDHVHIDSRRMALRLKQLPLEDLFVEQGDCDSLLRVRGEIDRSNMMIAAALSQGASTRFNDHQVVQDSMVLYGPGAEMEGKGGKGLKWLAVSIPYSACISYFEHCEKRSADFLYQRVAAGVRPGISSAAARWCSTLFLGPGPVWGGALWAERFLDAFFGAGFIDGAELESRSRRRKAVLAAEDYMRAHLSAVVTAEALCRAVGVSRRALEYYFHDIIGTSPKSYLRCLRLHEARRMLAESEGTWGSVRRIAKKCGFTHLGEFASTYKHLFGESPSVTLGLGRS